MKFFLVLSIFLSVPAFAKIILKKGEYYVVTGKGKTVPMSINALIKSGKASEIKLYDLGSVHMISASLNGGKNQLYSIGEDGFYYDLKPFSGYTVKSAEKGKVEFKEKPKMKFSVNEKGLFIAQ